MEILRNPRSAETYDVLVKEMFVLGSIFLIAAILFFLYSFKYIRKRADAKLMQTTWQDAHPETVAVRFQLYRNGQEVLWYPANVQISKVGDPGFNINQPIVSRASEIYLIPGSYKITVTTDIFGVQTVPITFPQTMIGFRTNCNATLE